MSQTCRQPGFHCFIFSFLLLIIFSGCMQGREDPSSLFQSTPGDGPQIRVDPLTEHTPEIPFPNDIATVLDTSSPEGTGRKLNVRSFAPTVFEENVREHLNELDGFGTFGPLYVSFDEALDLLTVRSDIRHLGDQVANTVLLLDMGSSLPYWGSRFVPLDTENNANFPIHIKSFPFPEERPFGPYTYDDGSNDAYYEQLLFRPDNAEDLDGDGEKEIVTFYEQETNTLIFRPVFPLRQQTEYLVVLTKGMKGKDGNSVCSPWSHVAHYTQIPILEKALPHLRAANIAPEDIAFAWTFTTQSVTTVLEAVRDGLDGEGKLAFLQGQHPPALNSVSTVDIGFLEKDGNPYLLNTDFLNTILSLVIPLIPELQGAPLHLDHVDYIVMGSFNTPDFRATKDEIFDIDLNRGTATVGEEEVPFLLCVPKTTAEHQPPFPVTLYCHGNQSIRFEGIASADYLAKQGIAVMAIDAVGHGPIINEKELLDELKGALEGLGLPEELTLKLELWILQILARLVGVKNPGDSIDEIMDQVLAIGFLNEVMAQGRAEDLSLDGFPDNGANFWTADTFKTRDVVRQTVIDLLYLLRVLQSFDQDKVPTEEVTDPGELDDDEAERYLMAGDFNMDNVLDVGGVDNIYYQSGISLGGIVSSIVLGVEPDIRAGVPVVPGGGLTDVMLRSDLKDVMFRIYYEVLGPVILGIPDGEKEGGTVSLRFQNNLRVIPKGTFRTEPNGRIYGINPRNGEDKWADTEDDSGFVIGVAADVGDVIQLTSYDADGRVLDQVELVSPLRGLGLERNTPRFRRFVSLAQITMDPGDPINYAPHWFMDPLPGMPQKKVFQLSDPGDLTVPINNQIALARVGGLLGDLRTDLAGVLDLNDKLIARQVLLGHDDPDFPLYDVEDRDQNNKENPSNKYLDFSCSKGESNDYCDLVDEDRIDPFTPTQPVATGNGKALIRFPFAKKHEFYGVPLSGYYSIYTVASQNQAGGFLGSDGEEWNPEWDCMIDRSEGIFDPETDELVFTITFGQDCPWEYEITARCKPDTPGEPCTPWSEEEPEEEPDSL